MTQFRLSLAIVILAMLVTVGANAQVLIAEANPAGAGQQAIFKVIGSSSAVCLDLFQLNSAGSLLTVSSYYVGPLQTVQVTAPALAGLRTTSVFAFSSPQSGSSTTACNSIPSAFLADATLAPQIYETLSGGNNGPVISVVQMAGAFAFASNFCAINNSGNNNVNQSASSTGSGNASASSSITSTNNFCNNFSNSAAASFFGPANGNSTIIQDSTAIVTFGFEEIGFRPADGNVLTTALAGCSSPSLRLAGAAVIVTCALPSSGGSLNTQAY